MANTDDERTVLGRIEGKLDLFAYQMGIANERGNDHEKRIRNVERWV